MLLFLWIGIPRGTKWLPKWMDLAIMEIEVTQCLTILLLIPMIRVLYWLQDIYVFG